LPVVSTPIADVIRNYGDVGGVLSADTAEQGRSSTPSRVRPMPSRTGRKLCPKRSRISISGFACGDDDQALAWLLRCGATGTDGRIRQDLAPRPARLTLRFAGRAARITEWDTRHGRILREQVVEPHNGILRHDTMPIEGDLALAIRSASGH